MPLTGRLDHHAAHLGVHRAEHTRLYALVRGADAAFTNLEMLFHDYEPYPMHESGGTYMRAGPALLREQPPSSH